MNNATHKLIQKVRCLGERKSNAVVWLIAIVLFAVVSITVPYFFTFRNITNVLISASTTGVMAIGLTLVMIMGGIDLSCPAVLAMSATIGCKWMVETGSAPLGILVGLFVGLCIGLFNGFAIGEYGMIPMIATLAVATMCTGFTNWLTQTQTITGMPEIFGNLFASKVCGVSVIILYYIILILIFHFILNKTIFGRSLFAIGTNVKAAEINGVNTKRLTIFVYALAGLIYAFGGLLASARVGGAGVSLGPQSNFTDVVTVVVLGGTSVSGGKGSIIGTLVASIIVAVISNVMNLTHISYYFTLIVKGAIVLAISYADVIRYRTKEAR